MDFETLKWYWGIFVQTWWLFKKYRNARTDKEWEIFVQEATILRQKYPGEFSKQIIMTVLDEIERINNQNGN